MRLGVITCLLLGYLIVPEYLTLQGVIESEFDLADSAASYYGGGRIVCDRPNLVYHLVHVHGVEPENILSNHYSPHYYGIDEPRKYLDWIIDQDIRVWTYIGDRGAPVWEVLQSNYPSVLTIIDGVPEMGVYAVDLSALDSLL